MDGERKRKSKIARCTKRKKHNQKCCLSKADLNMSVLSVALYSRDCTLQRENVADVCKHTSQSESGPNRKKVPLFISESLRLLKCWYGLCSTVLLYCMMACWEGRLAGAHYVQRSGCVASVDPSSLIPSVMSLCHGIMLPLLLRSRMLWKRGAWKRGGDGRKRGQQKRGLFDTKDLSLSL